MKNLIGSTAIVAAALGFVPVAQAIPVKWTVVYGAGSDGSALSGSFVYDADTNIYSDIDLETTDGTQRGGDSYTYLCEATPCAITPGDRNFMALHIPMQDDLTGFNILAVALLDQLTNAGGTVSTFISEGTCLDSNCLYINGIDYRNFFDTTLIHGEPLPQPQPPAITSVPTLNHWCLALLASLLGSLAFWRQRRHS